MEWLLISFVGITTVLVVNKFVIGLLLVGHAALRDGQHHEGADQRRPRFGWIMVRLPAVPLLEYRPPRHETAVAPDENRSGKRRSWWRALRH